MQKDKNSTGFDQFRKWLKANLYIGVGKSLLLWFLAISFVPLASMSFINYLYAYLGLTVVAEKSIVTTSQLRVEYLNTFFRELTNFTEIESEQTENLDFFNELRKQYNLSGLSSQAFTHSQDWRDLTLKKRKDLGQYINKQGYHDIYFIDRDGSILFSIREGSDLGTKLFTGEYANTLFSQTARESLRQEKLLFSDIAFYPPSSNIPTGFFCNVLKDLDGEVLGVFAVQITMDRINNIIQDDVGLGETGQAYLIGADLLMRSATRMEDQDIILHKMARTDKTLEWQQYVRNRDDEQYIINNNLLTEKITSYPNLNGNYVLGVYRNLNYLEQYGVNWALIEEIDNNEAYAYAQDLSDIAKVSFIVTIIIVFFIAILVTKKFVSPIKALSAWAKQVAIGDLVRKGIRAPRNEVGEMVDNFNSLVDSLRSYAKVSESAAFGDYTKSVIIRSERDVLGKSMNQMVESFQKVVEQANQIAQGDYSTNVKPRSEKDTLGIALYEMTKTLRHTSREIHEQDWLKSGISKLEGKLSGLKDIRKLSSEIIAFLVRYLDSQIGLIYIREENMLNLASSYAFKSDSNKFENIEFGEGLIGQVAMDKNTLLLSDPESSLPEIQLGTENKKNVHYLIAPFIFEGQVMGVIQIGSLNEFTELQRIFIERCLDRIAIAVNTVQVHTKVENLLARTQEQANELQSQQEELRQTNEELEEQTKALKLSEENLKSQQEELRVINEELEERTNDLELERDNIRKKNEELKTAQEEIKKKAHDLEMASKYKSEFLANMSHELRTPLNSILVLSQLLADNKKKHLNEKEIEYARTINSSGSDLLDLINEILDLSKVESGKLDLHIEAMYPNEVKDYIIRNFKPMMDEKDLELKIDFEKDIPKFIYTDAQRVLQVIKNFISNAIKFTAEGSITLHISKASKDLGFSNESLKEKEVVGISIIDTGIGIAEDKKQLIFEAFQQADGTTSRKYGGTGLGLTISKNFAELLNGEIMVKSEEGKGSAFTLFLPVSFDGGEKNVKPAEMEDQSEKKGQEKKRKTETLKEKNLSKKPEMLNDQYDHLADDRTSIIPGDEFILIIEDDINFCKVLIDLAHDRGFKCMVALDGETGLHFADYYMPSAVLLDIGLPGMDGYEVLEHLKESARTRHIPVHIISASDKSMDAMKMGAIGYLTKPVSQNKLESVFKKIENIISRPIRKAIVVEDDQTMRKSIVNLLDEGNVSIEAVGSGEEAYELLKKDKFECMILDLGLKELSGYELLERIRQDKKIKDLPVIIYTGQELSKEENERLNKYADSIILKGARSFERLLSEATLFLHQVQEEMPRNKQEMLKEIQEKESILKAKKILIVDDDMRNVFALTSVLENHGMKTIVGKNGREGIEKLKQNPDTRLILMDIMMPEMDGYEAIEEIRKDKQFKNLPIIALTAKAMKEDRAKCIAAGANDYVAKPVNSDKLISLLRVWLYSKK